MMPGPHSTYCFVPELEHADIATIARAVFNYDEATGNLIWKIRTGRKKLVGKIAGCVAQNHKVLQFLGRRMLIHRAVWIWHHGKEPAHFIDHINGNGHDNRIENLREANSSQNSANSRQRRSNALKGTRFREETGRWQAYFSQVERFESLGTFDTAEEAHSAYLKRAKEVFGEFARSA